MLRLLRIRRLLSFGRRDARTELGRGRKPLQIAADDPTGTTEATQHPVTPKLSKARSRATGCAGAACPVSCGPSLRRAVRPSCGLDDVDCSNVSSSRAEKMTEQVMLFDLTGAGKPVHLRYN